MRFFLPNLSCGQKKPHRFPCAITKNQHMVLLHFFSLTMQIISIKKSCARPLHAWKWINYRFFNECSLLFVAHTKQMMSFYSTFPITNHVHSMEPSDSSSDLDEYGFLCGLFFLLLCFTSSILVKRAEVLPEKKFSSSDYIDEYVAICFFLGSDSLIINKNRQSNICQCQEVLIRC